MIKMRQFTSLLLSATMTMTSVSVYGSQNSSSDSSEEKGFAPRNIRKSDKALDFEIVDEKGNTINARFENDKNRGNISTLRSHMQDQNKELKRQVDFIRNFLNLPTDFYKQMFGNQFPKDTVEREYVDENVYKTKTTSRVDVPYLARELVNDYAVLEYYKRLDFRVQNEIYRQYNLKYKDSLGKIVRRSFARPMNTSLHGYWAQSLLFSGVIGGMMWQQLRTQYHLNPEAMIQHLESLKDPIAHISFYSFMVMNGITADLLQKGIAGRPTSKTVQALRVAIPYLGMSAGMMASSLTHEVATLAKSCAAYILADKSSVLSREENQPKKEVCDQAMDEFFNFENKVEQYIPMLISLTLSAGGSSAAQIMIHKASDGVKKAVASPKGQKILGTSFAKAAHEYGGKYVIKFLGLQVLARITPAGWAMNSATLATIAISVGQIAGFLYIDHQLLPWLNWNWAQIWRASLVDNVDEQLKVAYQKNQSVGWKDTNTSLTECREPDDAKKEKCQGDMRLILKNLQKQMDMWRMQNHSKFFTGVQSWSKIMNNLVQEVMVSESFYKFYVDEVYRAQKFQYKRERNIPLKGIEQRLDTNLPFRKTELFGINPLGHGECTTEEQKASGDCLDPMDMYFTHPDDLVKYQLNRIKFVVDYLTPFFTAHAKSRRSDKYYMPILGMQESHDALWERARVLNDEQFEYFMQLVNKLKSTNLKELAQTLALLNQAPYSPLFRNNQSAHELIDFIRSSLGDPNPMIAEGMMIPYVYSERHKDKFEGLPSKGSHFTHHTEYLIYQMFCGPQSNEQDRIMSFSTLFGPKFNPPSLLLRDHTGVLHVQYKDSRQTERTDVLCAAKIPFEKLYYSTIIDIRTGEKFPFLRYLNTHINPNILGEVASEHTESTSNVDTWWDSTIINPVRNMFAFMDDKYQNLLVELVHGLQPDDVIWDKHVGYTKKPEPQISYTLTEKIAALTPQGKAYIDKAKKRQASGKNTDASRSLLDSTQEEINTYLTVLGAIERSLKPEVTERTAQIAQDDTSFLKSMNKTPTAVSVAQTELVSNINQLIARLKRVTVVDRQGKLKVLVPKNEAPLQDLTDKLEASVESYKKHVSSLKLDTYQKEVAALSLEGLVKSAASLTGYLLNIQLTNFSAMTSYDKYIKSNQNNSNNTMAPATKQGFHGK